MLMTEFEKKKSTRTKDTETRGDPVEKLAGKMTGYCFKPRLYGNIKSNLTVETDFLERYVPYPIQASVFALYLSAKKAARVAARIAGQAFDNRGRR